MTGTLDTISPRIKCKGLLQLLEACKRLLDGFVDGFHTGFSWGLLREVDCLDLRQGICRLNMGRRLDHRGKVVDPDALEELARKRAYRSEAPVMLYAGSVKVKKRMAQVKNLYRRTS